MIYLSISDAREKKNMLVMNISETPDESLPNIASNIK